MNRPSPISRSVSSSSSESSEMSRPSLLRDLRSDVAAEAIEDCQTPWAVSDTQLRPVPPFYPPLSPRCTALIVDAPPSVVASRISDCLKKRSVSVEYDDETVTAVCMTADRVHFTIKLHRGKRTAPPVDVGSVDTIPDFSHAVIVEVLRQRGPTMSFHYHCRSILDAAMSHCNGEDMRAPIHTSPFEFNRFGSTRPAKRVARMAASPSQALIAVERSLALLRKDRIDAQKLGMESLVALTDKYTSGDDLAVYGSMAVVGAPIAGESNQDDSCFEEVHALLVQLIRERTLPNEVVDDAPNTSFASSVSTLQCTSTSESASKKKSKSKPDASPIDDEYHGGLLRSMALRVMANSLTLLSEKQSTLLSGILKSSPLVSKEFLKSLTEDIHGGQRFPSVVRGTRLASAHEAVFATCCLRLLAQYAPTAQRYLVNPKKQSNAVLETLSKNRGIRHPVLRHETEAAFELLSQDVRSC